MSSPARTRPTIIVTAVIAALVLGLLSTTAQADDKARKRHVDKRISRLKNDLESTSRQLENAIHALRRAESKLKSAQARVARIRGRLAAAEARDAMLAEKLQVAVAEVQRAEQAIARTEAKIAGTQRIIGRMARSSYQEGGYGELSVVLNSQSPDDFATRLVLVQDALRSKGVVLTNLADDKADLAAQRATLDAKRDLIAQMKREQEQLVQTIKGLEAEAVTAQKEVESLVSEREGAVAAVQRERAAERSRLAAAESQSRALARRIAAAAAAAWRGRPTGASAPTPASASTR
jgi:peptidoglycan hydrolase CwlO-like protein